MINILDIIAIPLGYIIELIYKLVKNYGAAIILFTVISRLLLLPLTIKSQKAMKKQQMIQPALAELQRKYANDKEKLQTEMMKLYKENDVSMTGGCLPLLIQMPILIGLYRVIQGPLKYILGVDFSLAENIEKATTIVAQITEKFPEMLGSMKSYSVEQIIKNGQIQLSRWSETIFGAGDSWVVNFNFLGLDLAKVPSEAIKALTSSDFSNMSTILLLVIPALAIFTTWLSMKQSQKLSGQSSKNTQENETAAQMTNSMSIMMPLMTGFFSFTLPSGLGIYWIVSNVLQMAQQYFLNNYFNSKEDDFVVKLPEKNRKNSKKRR